jgi:hypothetical protein
MINAEPGYAGCSSAPSSASGFNVGAGRRRVGRVRGDVARFETKHPDNYDAAVAMLSDFESANAQTGDTRKFTERVERLREVHRRKTSVQERFDHAGPRRCLRSPDSVGLDPISVHSGAVGKGSSRIGMRWRDRPRTHTATISSSSGRSTRVTVTSIPEHLGTERRGEIVFQHGVKASDALAVVVTVSRGLGDQGVY